MFYIVRTRWDLAWGYTCVVLNCSWICWFIFLTDCVQCPYPKAYHINNNAGMYSWDTMYEAYRYLSKTARYSCILRLWICHHKNAFGKSSTVVYKFYSLLLITAVWLFQVEYLISNLVPMSLQINYHYYVYKYCESLRHWLKTNPLALTAGYSSIGVYYLVIHSIWTTV